MFIAAAATQVATSLVVHPHVGLLPIDLFCLSDFLRRGTMGRKVGGGGGTLHLRVVDAFD